MSILKPKIDVIVPTCKKKTPDGRCLRRAGHEGQCDGVGTGKSGHAS